MYDPEENEEEPEQGSEYETEVEDRRKYHYGQLVDDEYPDEDSAYS